MSTVGNNIHIIESNHFFCVVSSKMCMCTMTVVFDTDPVIIHTYCGQSITSKSGIFNPVDQVLVPRPWPVTPRFVPSVNCVLIVGTLS